MGLQLYNKKRNFSKTPEPAGRASKAKGNTFVVQKHDATRLHYDFRLELDGVLLSWAITRGPSLYPKDKRLAVRTEDHPLSYGSFEGTIPKGEYGGGTVMLWDEGTWVAKGDPKAGLKKGHISFTLQGKRLKGDWALILMRGKASEKHENWLLVKEDDDEALSTDKDAVKFLDDTAFSISSGRNMKSIAAGTLPKNKSKKADRKPSNKSSSLESLRKKYKTVQLATLVTEPPQEEKWIHEVKYDGYRLLCFVMDKKATLLTRNGHDWTSKFKFLKEEIEALPVQNAVFDGEAVSLDKKGISNFGNLQAALSEGNTNDLHLYMFDLLHLNGRDLSKKPLLERKKTLQQLFSEIKSDNIHFSGHMTSDKAILEKACGMGLEGLISKKADSVYTQGRSKTWLKSKCSKRQEFIIAGFTKPKSGGRAIGALHLAYTGKGELKYAGKVGTGFSMEMARNIFKRLSPLETSNALVAGIPALAKRGTTWVRPEILCEVSFTEWTKDGHVRHPSFEGLREDKRAEQVTMEKPVATGKISKKTTTSKKNDQKSRKSGDLKVKGLVITHPEREVFKDVHLTKGDIAEYYAAMAPRILKHIKNHPLSVLRCPSGIDGECFFQRNPDTHMQSKIKPFDFVHKGKKHEYMYIDDEEGLVFLAQMGMIELHPWGSTVSKIDVPDRMIFDLDPDETVPFDAVKMAALDMRKRLEKSGFKKTLLKCTGGKGLHVIVPLTGNHTWPEIKALSKSIAETAAKEVPEAYVATMTKLKREGKIFIDYFRNDYTATAIADYSIRAREGAPVAVPLEWDELDNLKSANQFSIHDVLKRII